MASGIMRSGAVETAAPDDTVPRPRLPIALVATLRAALSLLAAAAVTLVAEPAAVELAAREFVEREISLDSGACRLRVHLRHADIGAQRVNGGDMEEFFPRCVCALIDQCADVYVDASPTHDRRYCSVTCQNRARVAAYRARRRG